MPTLLLAACGGGSGSGAYPAPTLNLALLAGQPGGRGSLDGAGSAARFSNPRGVAIDAAGQAYVADGHSHTIRKIDPSGLVTTLAGRAGMAGAADGAGSAARFYQPSGVAVDAVGSVYVADTYNHTIRKISPAGVVTTLAGLAATAGGTDGTGEAARFSQPSAVALGPAGMVYVADTGNSMIRKITPAGAVTTLAGLAATPGSTDGTGSMARFYHPAGVAVDAAGNVYVCPTSITFAHGDNYV